MKKLTLLVLSGWLVLSVWCISAATVYVRTTGNDTTGDGSIGNPWLTIDKALSYASLAAGDFIDVGSGSFASDANTDISGSSGNPITIRGAGIGSTYIRGKLTIDQQWYVVTNLTIDGHTTGGTYTGNYLALFGPNCQNILVEGVEIMRGIAGANFQDVGGAYPTNVTIRSCIFHHPTGNGMVAVVGHGHTVENCSFAHSAGNDAIRVFGPNHTFRSNRFEAIHTPTGAPWTNQSSTSVSIGTGTKTWTTASGLSWGTNYQMEIFPASAPSSTMRGFVTSYSGTSLEVDVYTATGSGTYTDWVIRLLSDGNHADIIQSFVDSNNHPTTNLLFIANYATNCSSQLGNVDNNAANTILGRWTFASNVFDNCRIQFNCYIPYVTWTNNTFYNSSGFTTGIRFVDSSGTKGAASNAVVRGNIFCRMDGLESGGGAVASEAGLLGYIEEYNIFTDLTDTDFTSMTTGTGSINGGYSPAQIFINAAGGNFQLASGSPAIGLYGSIDAGAFKFVDAFVPTIVTNNTTGARVMGFRGLGMSVFPLPAGTSYVWKQDFEGTGYDNNQTWTESGSGILNEDYTSTVLVGSQSMNIDLTSNIGTAYGPLHTLVESPTIHYAYFQLRVISFPSAAHRIFSISNVLDVSINATSNMLIRPAVGISVATVGRLEAGVTYHVWTSGSGQGIETTSQGTARVAFSTDGIKPTSGDNYAIDSDPATGPGTNPSQVVLGTLGIGANYNIIIDKIRVNDVVIGDNPE